MWLLSERHDGTHDSDSLLQGGCRPGDRPSHAVKLERLNAAVQHVVPQVYEHFCQVIAAFHIKCVDKRGSDKQRSIGRSAIRFDAAFNIHCIANYRESGRLSLPISPWTIGP